MSRKVQARRVKRGGRAPGAGNWRNEDFMALLDFVEDVLPVGKEEWEEVYKRFAEWARSHSRPPRSADIVERRYKTLIRISKPPRDGEFVRRAQAIEHLITDHVASGVIYDVDHDDEVTEISSDEAQVVSKKPRSYNARQFKVDPPTDPVGSAQLRRTLQNVVRFLDPAVRVARDTERHACRLEMLRFQGLMAQLRESKNDLRALQRELDRESRRADNAESHLRMFEMIHASASRYSTVYPSSSAARALGSASYGSHGGVGQSSRYYFPPHHRGDTPYVDNPPFSTRGSFFQYHPSLPPFTQPSGGTSLTRYYRDSAPC